MRYSHAWIVVPVFFLAIFAERGSAGQTVDMNSFQAGMRYCPAPWGDNREFLDSHYGVDAKTGELRKYTGTVHPDEIGDLSQSEEVLLYVAPNISAESRYVPPEQAFGRGHVPVSRDSRQAYATQPPAYPQQRQAPRQPRTSRVQPQSSGQARQYQQRRQQQYVAQAPQSHAQRQPKQQKSGGKLPWWKALFRK